MAKLQAKQHWTKEARKFFRDITKKFHIDEKHHATFYGTCENLNRFYLANTDIMENGITFKTASGTIHKNPACAIQKEAWGAYIVGLRALGLYEPQGKVGNPGG